jgi:8-oxo-dGDP phosphatase
LSGFRRVEEREEWSGWIYRVVTALFDSPSGERFERYVVCSPGAVSAVPIVYEEADGDRSTPKVVLMSQFRAAHDEMVIEIPAGVRDVDGESDEDNVRRELAEEVGLRPGHVELLTSIYPSAGMTNSVNSIYLATDCTAVERTPHGPEEEHAEVFRVPLTEAIAWVEDGRIVDAKSVVGMLLAERRLKSLRSPATQAVGGRSVIAFGHAGGAGASSLASDARNEEVTDDRSTP